MEKNKYKELGCEFKNESECSDDLDEELVDFQEAESLHYKDEE
mgnify:CR=1 FL=1